jgi:hypothetical protein
MAIETYHHSGSVGSKTLIGFVVAVALAAGPVAFAYQYAVDWAPYDALAILLVVAFGFALGLLAGRALSWGECRNMLLGSLVTLTVALAGLGGSYAASYQRFLGRLFETEARWPRFELMSKESFLRFLEARAASGWKVGSAQYSGPEVYGIWALEAIMVISCAWLGAREILLRPYCEACQRWTLARPKVTLRGVSAEEMKRAVSQDTVQALLGPDRRPEVTNGWMEYVVHQCQSCDHSDYVTVTFASGNPNNTKQQKRKVLVRSAVISRKEAQALA